MATTAWGKAHVIESISIEQDNDEKSFTTYVELLEDAEGEQFVRFAYATSGSTRRGPVTLRRRDLARLKKRLEKAPGLRAALELA